MEEVPEIDPAIVCEGLDLVARVSASQCFRLLVAGATPTVGMGQTSRVVTT